MALTVTELAEHIIARRRLYELALETDIELLRRAHGESVVEEALRLADVAAQPKQVPQTRALKMRGSSPTLSAA